MKSKTDEATEKAFYHALNFFKSNDRGVDNQRACVQQLMEITGFDFDTCLKIQNPILDFYMQVDMRNIGGSVIENNLQMVTQTIRNHLLNIQTNYSQKTFDQKSSNSILSCKDIIEKTTNPPHGNLLSDVRIIDISKSHVKNEDIGVLVQHLQYQGLNLNKFDASNNLLGYGAVENLFYTFSLSRSNTALYNIKFINLSNNQIGDDGAKYIASHLGNGQHPNLRYLDVSGNHITTNGGALFIEAMEAKPHQEIVIKTHDNTSSKTVWQYLKQAFNYFADTHHKENTETDKKWVGLYGDDEWAVCKKYLQAASIVIGAGFVKKSVDSKLILLSSKIPSLKGKMLAFSGIFLQIVKEDYKDLMTTDLLQCIAVINSKSLIDIKDYTTEIIGTTSDDFIFE
ncbi:hypothetical protein Trichorick_01686 (plasmid) [Candidatus Trichorickettsia mobilis]|nr:hypothetical protein Trichorick_01686 [Candidatus Trichorickettsia mobilis]